MREWVVSPHETVRRLASEGSRPLLPWGPKVPALIEDPNIGLEALTALRHDTSETVRRSVANHLNDVTKSNPTLVIEVLTKWSGEDPPVDQRLVKHALRSLLKAGNGGAMELVGFTSQPAVTISQFTCTPQSIELGSKINLYAEIASTSKADQRLLVDFVIHHVNASGGTSPKVFKWTNLTLKSKDTAEISKERSIQNRSTRTYHQGVHQVELQVAGKRLAETQFTIE